MRIRFPVIAVNGIVDAQVSPLDRGFMYGDGVFETCNLTDAKIPLWSFHRDRLLTSCRQLKIPVDIGVVESHIHSLVSYSAATDATVKITITRGQGGRGYKIPELIQTNIVVSIFDIPNYPAAYSAEGISARLCSQRLGRNPGLAGLKHLNRLEQILARSEWNDDSIAEGIMFDSENSLIEGVFSNIFIVKNGELFTPDLSSSGVAGIMRKLILEKIAPQLALKISICQLGAGDLAAADEIFMCNSLYGIWPVRNIAGLADYKPDGFVLTKKLQQYLTILLNKLSM